MENQIFKTGTTIRNGVEVAAFVEAANGEFV